MEESKAVFISLAASDSKVALILLAAVLDLVDEDLGIWVNANGHVFVSIVWQSNVWCILSISSLVAYQLTVAVFIFITVSLTDSAWSVGGAGVMSSDSGLDIEVSSIADSVSAKVEVVAVSKHSWKISCSSSN